MEKETKFWMFILSFAGILIGGMLNFLGCLITSGLWIFIGFCAPNVISIIGIIITWISIPAFIISMILLLIED